MRIVTYGAACSLDGFIAGSDGDIGWIHMSPDVGDIMKQFWSGVDTMLMGRKTFEHAVRSGGGGGSFSGVVTYLFSRTLVESPDPNVHLVKEDAGGFVRKLKGEAGKGICVMSGGNLAASLLQAGVIDEVGLNIHPVLLGAGTRAFEDAHRSIPLELIQSRQIAGGCVYVRYRVKPTR